MWLIFYFLCSCGHFVLQVSLWTKLWSTPSSGIHCSSTTSTCSTSYRTGNTHTQHNFSSLALSLCLSVSVALCISLSLWLPLALSLSLAFVLSVSVSLSLSLSLSPHYFMQQTCDFLPLF